MLVFQTPTPSETHSLFGTNGSNAIPPIDIKGPELANQVSTRFAKGAHHAHTDTENARQEKIASLLPGLLAFEIACRTKQATILPQDIYQGGGPPGQPNPSMPMPGQPGMPAQPAAQPVAQQQNGVPTPPPTPFYACHYAGLQTTARR